MTSPVVPPGDAPTVDEPRAWSAPTVLPLQANPKSVAIVAMGGSMGSFTQLACAKGGVEAIADEIWTINATAAVIKHHRAFVMDDLRHTIPREAEEEKRMVAAGILKWLPAHPGPVYTSTAYPEYPALVEFPLRDVLQSVGGFPYLNTTVAYAIAFAIHLKVKELHLYGCDYTYPDVHISESGRGCAEFLLGIAANRGMQLHLPETTTLLDFNVPLDRRFYGYHGPLLSDVVDGQVVLTRPTSSAEAVAP